jgi:hypothetical protein
MQSPVTLFENNEKAPYIIANVKVRKNEFLMNAKNNGRPGPKNASFMGSKNMETSSASSSPTLLSQH